MRFASGWSGALWAIAQSAAGFGWATRVYGDDRPSGADPRMPREATRITIGELRRGTMGLHSQAAMTLKRWSRWIMASTAGAWPLG